MTEIILVIVIVALLASIGVSQYNGIKERERLIKDAIQEREKLIKLIKAKDLREITDNEVMEKVTQEEVKPPDVVELHPDDEATFDKTIEAQLEYGERTTKST